MSMISAQRQNTMLISLDHSHKTMIRSIGLNSVLRFLKSLERTEAVYRCLIFNVENIPFQDHTINVICVAQHCKYAL